MSDFVVLRSPEQWQEAASQKWKGRRSTVSIGNFDGLHLGHREILKRVAARARATGTIATVVTFDPHPLKVLRPQQAPPLVETFNQRLAGIGACGVDAALVLHFDPAFAALGAEEFVRSILVDLLRAETILLGANFRFGYRQQGDVALLSRLGPQYGFTLEIVPPVVVPGPDGAAEVVSSTAVRRAVLEGRVQGAARLLGRPFVLTGEIEKGSGRGSTVLFPTLNLRPEQELLPKTGVYATEVRVLDSAAAAAQSDLIAGASGQLHGDHGVRSVYGVYGAATNVGFRPTFDGTHLSIESHLFEFSRQVTAGRLEVSFRERLRDERKFSGADELRRQIAADLDRAREILHRLPLSTKP